MERRKKIGSKNGEGKEVKIKKEERKRGQRRRKTNGR